MFEPQARLDEPARSPPPAWMGRHSVPSAFIADRRYGLADRRNPDAASAAGTNSHETALAEARAAGELAGRAAANEEFAQEKALWGKLKLGLAQLDEQAQQILADQLRETVAALCERALEPLALDPQLLAKRCLSAARMIGEAAGPLSLHIHPDDIASLDPDFIKQWPVKPDADLARGSLRFDGADGKVSCGPAEWRAAIASALGTC